jgi:hypothetical protein
MIQSTQRGWRWSEAAAVTAAACLLVWVWVMAVGRDLSWDVANHHLYLPFSLLSGHYRTDLFAAGPQSYQNPLGFLPFYGLVRLGGPSWIVGTGLALIHALAFWPLHRLTVAIWGDGADTRWWRLMALALAAATPMFLLLAGTSSLDALSAVLMLASLALVAGPSGSTWMAAASGGLSGLAFAVKPVNAVFIIGLFAVIGLRLISAQMKFRDTAAWGAGALLIAAVCMGPWCWWLWTTFGNPLFPLYNQYFHSPFAPQQAVLASRFMPATAWDWLLRPLEMAQYGNFASTEALAPDLRPLAASVLLLPAAVLAWRRHRGGVRAWAGRADVQLVAFCAASYPFWLLTSGNSRYALPALMLTGLLLTRFAELLAPRRIARIGLGVLLTLQVAYYGTDGDRRIAAQAWDNGPFLAVTAHPRLVEQPYLHLSVGTLTYASLAPYLHPDGAMANLVGQMSIPQSGPLNDALQQRLQQWQGRTRFLFRAMGMDAESASKLPQRMKDRANRLVARFGLSIDFQDCLPVNLVRETKAGLRPIHLMSCGAQTAPVPAATPEDALAAKVFARLEAACPRLYGPTPLATDNNGDAWQRLYVNSDLRVTVSAEDGVVVSHHRSMNLAVLGTLAEVAAGGGRDPCIVWRELDVQQGRR